MSTPPPSPNSSNSSASQPASSAPAATCPRCGRAIPANSVLGTCPHCLLAAGLASEPAAPVETAPPPAPAELAPEFPQLELLELLGRGGMGAVYKARQKSLDRFVALKLLRSGLDADPSFAERFTREARALAQLNHPGIVTLYEFGRTPGGLFFILMEFVDGLNLRQLLAAGRLAPREALAIIPPLCDALQYAHDRGLVHRDIKPENILVDRLGRVKVADFGLAKLAATTSDTKTSGASDATGHWSLSIGHSGLTETGKVMGTPSYMSPEQRNNPDAVDHRADIYALGVVLYQMLTGELPDTKQLQPPSHRVQLDIRLDEIVLRALETEPSRRYQHASALKTQVETISAPSLSTTPAITTGRPGLPSTRRASLIAISIFGFFYALHLAWVFSSASDLPAVVASHFGMSGRADGFMSKTGYLIFVCAFPLALGLFLQGTVQLALRLPVRFVNLPNREIWLAPGRRAELAEILTTSFALLSCAIVIFSAQIHTLTLLANRLQPPRLSDIALFSLMGFPVVLMLWVIGLLMRLAEPTAAPQQQKRRELIFAAVGAALVGFFSTPLILAWNSPETKSAPPSAPAQSVEPDKGFSPGLTPGTTTTDQTRQKILQLKLAQARRQLEHTKGRYDAGLTTNAELQSAQDDVALIEADLAGDKLKIVQINTAAAERRLADILARYNTGLTTAIDVESAKTDLAVLKLEMSKPAGAGQPASPDHSSPPPNPHPAVSTLITPRLQFREVLPAPTATTETLSFAQDRRSETLHLSTQILMDEKAVSDVTVLPATSAFSSISLQFSTTGAQQFTEITRTLVGKRLAILFDGRVLIAPTINQPITGGSAQISGRFSPDEINDLAKSIREVIAHKSRTPPNVPDDIRLQPPSVEVIVIQEDGTYLIDSRTFSLEQLNEHFATLSRQPTPPVVHIKTSEKAAYQYSPPIMNAARRNNLNRITLDTHSQLSPSVSIATPPTSQ